MTLTKEQILDADDLKATSVPVPEWGGEVRVRVMTSSERDRFVVTSTNGAGKFSMDGATARLCGLCLVDDAGARLFTERELQKLGEKSSQAMQRVFDAACELNGLSEEGRGAVEKN